MDNRLAKSFFTGASEKLRKFEEREKMIEKMKDTRVLSIISRSEDSTNSIIEWIENESDWNIYEKNNATCFQPKIEYDLRVGDAYNLVEKLDDEDLLKYVRFEYFELKEVGFE